MSKNAPDQKLNFDWDDKTGITWNWDVTVSLSIENDGIGAYEFWGAKCYGLKGTNCLVVDSILSAKRSCYIEGTKNDWTEPEIVDVKELEKLIPDMEDFYDHMEGLATEHSDQEQSCYEDCDYREDR